MILAVCVGSLIPHMPELSVEVPDKLVHLLAGLRIPDLVVGHALSADRSQVGVERAIYRAGCYP